jgi:hypothetical protein
MRPTFISAADLVRRHPRASCCECSKEANEIPEGVTWIIFNAKEIPKSETWTIFNGRYYCPTCAHGVNIGVGD